MVPWGTRGMSYGAGVLWNEANGTCAHPGCAREASDVLNMGSAMRGIPGTPDALTPAISDVIGGTGIPDLLQISAMLVLGAAISGERPVT